MGFVLYLLAYCMYVCTYACEVPNSTPRSLKSILAIVPICDENSININLIPLRLLPLNFISLPRSPFTAHLNSFPLQFSLLLSSLLFSSLLFSSLLFSSLCLHHQRSLKRSTPTGRGLCYYPTRHSATQTMHSLPLSREGLLI